jgi:putative transposase
MAENAVEAESVEQAVEPSVSAVSDEQLIAMLVDRTRSEGLQSSGRADCFSS